MITPTYEDIKPYIEKKLISMQRHPDHREFAIFNYTQKCQFDGLWDEVTINCRGLILDLYNNTVVARPFRKFFNYGEYLAKGWIIPTEEPIISEKYDGSLGILYWLHGKPYIATRGVFDSEQALWATKWFRDNVEGFTHQEGITHLFEIIYPANRIVINYDFSGLVYLGTIENDTGRTLLDQKFPDPMRNVGRVSAYNLDVLSKMDEPNREGFVILFPRSDVRMKIKFPEYVRLHKLVTGVSEIAIWEHLREGKTLDDLLDKVPDEFFAWVKSVEKRLVTEFNILWEGVEATRDLVFNFETRKDQALYIMEFMKELSGAVFCLLDDKEKEARDDVWKSIRPRGSSQFKNDIDS